MNLRMGKLWGGLALTALLSLKTTATTFYVDANGTNPILPYTDWSTAATNIQDAIDAATNADLILVTNGVYATGGRVVYGSLTNRVVINKAIAVQSVNGAALTAILGYANNGANMPTNSDNAVRCVYLTNNATLNGFTLAFGATRSAGNAVQEESGGGAWCEGTNANLSNCIIVTNSAKYDGGGIYSGTLFHCTLANNFAISGNGGASGSSTLNNCLITNNIASYGGGMAGGMANNCLFVANGTNAGYGTDGGAAYGGTLNNCTLVGNVAKGFGAADGCTLCNSIIYYNSNGIYADCYQCRLTNCCTTMGVGNSSLPNNSFTNPPVFVDLANGNYRLQSNSPCINTGNNTAVSGTVDLDGRPRIISGTVDMGSYEYQGTGMGEFIAWLQQYGLPTDGSADSADTDGDGMNNWQEWKAGTVPTNAASVLQLAAPTNGLSGMVVTWQSVTNINYYLQRSSDLAGGFSSIVSNLVGQAGTTSYTDISATNAGPYFYRVGVQ